MRSSLMSASYTQDLEIWCLQTRASHSRPSTKWGISNIPPFLNNGKFTASKIKLTKGIATCHIHVERANARLKEFKTLSFVSSYMRCYAEKVLQLCASLVNFQYPLIKEISDSLEFVMISVELKSNTAQFLLEGKFTGNIFGHQSGRFCLFMLRQSMSMYRK